jgi:hypothetical protein
MTANKKKAPTTMPAEYWKAEALRHRNEKIDLKLDIFFGTTPIELEIKKKAKKNSQQPRPRAVSKMAEAIKKAMKEGKTSGQSFKLFMATWAHGHIDGFTVKFIEASDEYLITDENGDLGQAHYTKGTLTRMYSKS